MAEKLADTMMKTSEALYWLGKYEESAALSLLARFLKAKGIEDLDDLGELIVSCESGE